MQQIENNYINEPSKPNFANIFFKLLYITRKVCFSMRRLVSLSSINEIMTICFVTSFQLQRVSNLALSVLSSRVSLLFVLLPTRDVSPHNSSQFATSFAFRNLHKCKSASFLLGVLPAYCLPFLDFHTFFF